MSDPTDNAKVEDVLSSIRRLVSNNGSKKRDAAAEDASPMTREALILTSACRVDDPATELEAHDVDSRTPDMENLRAVLAGHAAAVNGAVDLPPSRLHFSATDAEPPNESGVVAVDTANDKFAWEEADEAEEDDYYEDEHTSSVGDVPDDWQVEDVTAQAPVAPVEGSDVIDEEVEWTEIDVEDLDDPVEADEATPEAAEWLDETDTAEDVDPAWQADDEASEQSGDTDPAEQIAETEEVESMTSDDTTPASDPPKEVAAIAPVAATPYDADDVDLADLSESVLDEDMLRDLVADIVREELTGVLGERITRNVRKLVRREVHRAMLTKDFD